MQYCVDEYSVGIIFTRLVFNRLNFPQNFQLIYYSAVEYLLDRVNAIYLKLNQSIFNHVNIKPTNIQSAELYI